MEKRIVKNLKGRRLECGMTATELAQKLGITRTTLFRWEKGDIALNDKKVEAIADILHCTPEELFVDKVSTWDLSELANSVELYLHHKVRFGTERRIYWKQMQLIRSLGTAFSEAIRSIPDVNTLHQDEKIFTENERYWDETVEELEFD